MIRGSDLRPKITDLAAFRGAMATDRLAEPIELLWSGDPSGALRLLAAEEPTLRVRALRADCLRDLGEASAAVQEYDSLVAETVGTAREASMRQHRGKALLSAGRAAEAVQDFRAVIELRSDADPTLLDSARQALEVAALVASSEVA
ncbi:hypothetical protein GCM10011575_11100 [Microlunatus endophyticus]|uniref:Tetratricopeptide repeat-containing protein n=1 Tax=Microlunatus endophyticus TaxID=1716077 RepID=A0A917S4R8_9ACTN|nr:hypothetical protein GCM10011575_11100 [Microlunatus endophyticus]